MRTLFVARLTPAVIAGLAAVSAYDDPAGPVPFSVAREYAFVREGR